VEGIAAILCGYPAIPKSPVIGSALEQTSIDSLARILAAQGYGSLFIHGAFRGSMWFDAFARRAGFGRYIAQEDFPGFPEKSDGTWGVYDEYTLERLHEEIAAAPKPVLAFLFTLNPHTPFQLPPGRQAKFPADLPGADMMNAFAYTDAALGRFFDLARQSSYWKNTIFVVTADHNMGKGPLNRREAMWIPLLILDPGNADFPAGTISAVLGGQADIAPTVLDLLGFSGEAGFAGRSLLDPGGTHFALHAWADQAGWQEQNWFIVHNLRKPAALYDLDNDPDLQRNLLRGNKTPPSAAAALNDFQAYLQITNNLLLQNRIMPSAAAPHSR
jgi:phosphoglycerol transferase MdoB-like AlkP superfamily enzyme